MDFPVLPWGNAVFLFKGSEERGIIGEAHLLGNAFQGKTLLDKTFGRNQTALGDTAVEADPIFFRKA